VRAAGGCCKMIDLFRAEKLDAVAGVRSRWSTTPRTIPMCA
jgi:hypothetical protein